MHFVIIPLPELETLQTVGGLAFRSISYIGNVLFAEERALGQKIFTINFILISFSKF